MFFSAHVILKLIESHQQSKAVHCKTWNIKFCNYMQRSSAVT